MLSPSTVEYAKLFEHCADISDTIALLKKVFENNEEKMKSTDSELTVLISSSDEYFTYNLYSNGFVTLSNSFSETLVNENLKDSDILFKVPKYPWECNPTAFYIFTIYNILIDSETGEIIRAQSDIFKIILNSISYLLKNNPPLLRYFVLVSDTISPVKKT